MGISQHGIDKEPNQITKDDEALMALSLLLSIEDSGLWAQFVNGPTISPSFVAITVLKPGSCVQDRNDVWVGFDKNKELCAHFTKEMITAVTQICEEHGVNLESNMGIYHGDPDGYVDPARVHVVFHKDDQQGLKQKIEQLTEAIHSGEFRAQVQSIKKKYGLNLDQR